MKQSEKILIKAILEGLEGVERVTERDGCILGIGEDGNVKYAVEDNEETANALNEKKYSQFIEYVKEQTKAIEEKELKSGAYELSAIGKRNNEGNMTLEVSIKGCGQDLLIAFGNIAKRLAKRGIKKDIILAAALYEMSEGAEREFLDELIND